MSAAAPSSPPLSPSISGSSAPSVAPVAVPPSPPSPPVGPDSLSDASSLPLLDVSSPSSSSAVSDYIPEPSKVDPALLQPLLPSELISTLSLSPDISLTPYFEEYSKLQQALKKSHESESRFINKCKSLLKQTRAHSHKVNALQAMQGNDLKRKKQYQEEIEKIKSQTSKIVDESREKRESIKKGREELNAIASQLELDSAEHMKAQRAKISMLELEINKLTQIRDRDRSALTKLRAANIDKFQSLQGMLAQQSRAQSEFDAIESKIVESKALAGKELKRKAELEKHMKELQGRVSERQGQISHKKNLIEAAKKDLQEVQNQLMRSEAIVQSHKEEYEMLSQQAQQENAMLVSIQEENEENVKRLKKEQKELDEERASVKQMKAACENKLKMLEIMKDKVNVMNEETRIVEEEKSRTSAEMKLTKELSAAMQLKLNNNSKAMDTCIREREVLAQQHANKIDSIKQKEAILKIRQSTLKNIQNEHQGYLMSIRSLTKIIEELKADKFSHEQDLIRRQEQRNKALQEVELREQKIQEYQQQIIINEGKYRQQMNLLEAVRGDRNVYRKTLIEQQNEMHEMKRKFLHFSAQVKQLKAEINDKDTTIVVEHFQSQAVKNDIYLLSQQNEATKKSLELTEAEIKKQNKQIRQLAAIIADADEELKNQIKQYNAIVNEQRVLNQHLIERNEELAKLYDQLKLQTAILNKSQLHYAEKQAELIELGHTKDELISTMDQVLKDVEKFEELKQSIGQHQQMLIDEQLRVKALQDELKKPINIHRWRRMQDTNTDTYGMIKKVRALQKQIIEKQELIEEKAAIIQEKEKLYVDLRKILSRQPNANESQEKIAAFEEEYLAKKAKLKQMEAELAVFQKKCKELKYGIEKANSDLQLIKLNYYQKRRKEQQQGQKADMVNDFEKEFRAAMEAKQAEQKSAEESKVMRSDSSATPAEQAGYYPIQSTEYQKYISAKDERDRDSNQSSPSPDEESKESLEQSDLLEATRIDPRKNSTDSTNSALSPS